MWMTIGLKTCKTGVKSWVLKNKTKQKKGKIKNVFTAINPRFSLLSDVKTSSCSVLPIQYSIHQETISSSTGLSHQLCHFILWQMLSKKLIMHTWSVKIWNSWIQQTIRKWMRNNVMYVKNKTKQRKYFPQRKFKLTCITAEIRLAALSELTLRNKTRSGTEQHTKRDILQSDTVLPFVDL